MGPRGPSGQAVPCPFFFSSPNHGVSITRQPDQYLLCMAFSLLRQHLKASDMTPPGTRPPGNGLFVQTSGDIARVDLN